MRYVREPVDAAGTEMIEFFPHLLTLATARKTLVKGNHQTFRPSLSEGYQFVAKDTLGGTVCLALLQSYAGIGV